MGRLKLLDDGIIYKNPDPGLRAECAFLPNVVPLDGVEVICIYRIGQAFYSTDGTLNVARSTDGGKTWEQEGRVWDVASDDRPYNYSAPHAFRLEDGTLVLTASTRRVWWATMTGSSCRSPIIPSSTTMSCGSITAE